MKSEGAEIKGARSGQGKHEAIGRGASWEMAAVLTDEQKRPSLMFSIPANNGKFLDVIMTEP
jgi:hypothetical protein